MKQKVLLVLLTLMTTPAFADKAFLRGVLVPDKSSIIYDSSSKECKATGRSEDIPWGITYMGLEGYRVAAYLVVNGQKQRLADVVVPPEKIQGFLDMPHVTWPPNATVEFYFTIEDGQGTLVDDASRSGFGCTAQ